MKSWEVIESKLWQHKETGAKVSIYGALPWGPGASEAVKAKWEIVSVGWTVRNPLTNEVGVGRPASKTRDEAEKLAERLGKPSRFGIGD